MNYLKTIYYLISFTIVTSLSTGISASDNFNEVLQLDRAKLELKRENFIAKTLMLSTDESKQFWPLYKEYRKAVSNIDTKTIQLLKDYAKSYNNNEVSNEIANRLMSEFLQVDLSRINLKARYMKKFTKKLPAKLVWRYFHAENNLDTMIRYAYISQIPLVKQ
ncbi:hypothetical protein [Aliikangiella coralliicola]|uniref:Uncharacterized protein n=1 Tax=Aliikangiella coralliicola TaxID=2592383 RepID=A0A545U954_9GAMM|nr:hypothetical protein [Aliikangiella coralliicola]TQV85959.1 hypothetical protein FLL46_18755 [Aliikangiella coralliicola]